MSLCMCPESGIDGMHSPEHKAFVNHFLANLAPDGHYAASDWNLLNLKELTNKDDVPYRGGFCNTTRKCCGVCTKKCTSRCVQDCLHRLWVWNQMVKNTPEDQRDRLPLQIRLIVKQKFESHAHMSLCIGEILSVRTNTSLRQYMSQEGVTRNSHPYKNDYSPMEVLDPKTGRRKINKATGEIQIAWWPESGLCPYCMPKVTIDTHYCRGGRKK